MGVINSQSLACKVMGETLLDYELKLLHMDSSKSKDIELSVDNGLLSRESF